MRPTFFKSNWAKAGLLAMALLLGLWGVRSLQSEGSPNLISNPEQQNLKEFEEVCSSYVQDMLGLTPSKAHTLSEIQTNKLSTGYTLEAYINADGKKRWFACEANSDANRIVTTIHYE